MTALKQLKINKELVVTKADRGNKGVIMNVNDYKTKINVLYSDNDTYKPCVKTLWNCVCKTTIDFWFFFFVFFAIFPNLNKKNFN